MLSSPPPPLPLRLFSLLHGNQLYLPPPQRNPVPSCPHHFFLWGAASLLFSFLLFVGLLPLGLWLLLRILELFLHASLLPPSARAICTHERDNCHCPSEPPFTP